MGIHFLPFFEPLPEMFVISRCIGAYGGNDSKNVKIPGKILSPKNPGSTFFKIFGVRLKAQEDFFRGLVKTGLLSNCAFSILETAYPLTPRNSEASQN